MVPEACTSAQPIKNHCNTPSNKELNVSTEKAPALFQNSRMLGAMSLAVSIVVLQAIWGKGFPVRLLHESLSVGNRNKDIISLRKVSRAALFALQVHGDVSTRMRTNYQDEGDRPPRTLDWAGVLDRQMPN
ncbi:hypothetical protein T440DRAFT_511751 [Plenodomus tracheiphilus IPT5]|uniref:Uncharacterized protein n=1 Tax=Plenodomus tracheiphilus IPT5 TaxID=1408161 RepID=A0A6A7AS58_9PLEO|nr:hypothetical protein T440DRAFT_511751 [Plenodomus tracheiphilus IPT5]